MTATLPAAATNDDASDACEAIARQRQLAAELQALTKDQVRIKFWSDLTNQDDPSSRGHLFTAYMLKPGIGLVAGGRLILDDRRGQLREQLCDELYHTAAIFLGLAAQCRGKGSQPSQQSQQSQPAAGQAAEPSSEQADVRSILDHSSVPVTVRHYEAAAAAEAGTKAAVKGGAQ